VHRYQIRTKYYILCSLRPCWSCLSFFLLCEMYFNLTCKVNTYPEYIPLSYIIDDSWIVRKLIYYFNTKTTINFHWFALYSDNRRPHSIGQWTYHVVNSYLIEHSCNVSLNIAFTKDIVRNLLSFFCHWKHFSICYNSSFNSLTKLIYPVRISSVFVPSCFEAPINMLLDVFLLSSVFSIFQIILNGFLISLFNHCLKCIKQYIYSKIIVWLKKE
jgi:hypothetical protein